MVESNCNVEEFGPQVSFSARLTAYTVATFTADLQAGYIAHLKGILAQYGANCQVAITGLRSGSVIVDTQARHRFPCSPVLHPCGGEEYFLRFSAGSSWIFSWTLKHLGVPRCS